MVPEGDNVLFSIGVIVGVTFWTLFGIGLVWRIVSLIVRRRSGELKKRVVAPLVSSVAVQSEFFGWKPQTTEDLRPYPSLLEQHPDAEQVRKV